MSNKVHIFGILAEFERPEELLEAAKRVCEKGYVKVDAYSPFPIHGIDEALRIQKTNLPMLVLCGGLAGGLGGYLLQVFTTIIDFPINIGGRPLHSWPAFVPVTFELTVLVAGITAAVGMLALNGFPKPYNPLFNSPKFQLASRDRFFLSIEATDPKYNSKETAAFLQTLHPLSVAEIDE